MKIPESRCFSTKKTIFNIKMKFTLDRDLPREASAPIGRFKEVCKQPFQPSERTHTTGDRKRVKSTPTWAAEKAQAMAISNTTRVSPLHVVRFARIRAQFISFWARGRAISSRRGRGSLHTKLRLAFLPPRLASLSLRLDLNHDYFFNYQLPSASILGSWPEIVPYARFLSGFG